MGLAMTENDDSATETSAETETSASWVPQRMTDEEARERVAEILLNAALESGAEVDKVAIDEASASIVDGMRKMFL